jgi:hypothetical protein
MSTASNQVSRGAASLSGSFGRPPVRTPCTGTSSGRPDTPLCEAPGEEARESRGHAGASIARQWDRS